MHSKVLTFTSLSMVTIKDVLDFTSLFIWQLITMSDKIFVQRSRNGRQFLKDTFMIQLCCLGFTALIMLQASKHTVANVKPYKLITLPPLTMSSNGVFNSDLDTNVEGFSDPLLYFTPNNHQGIQDLISSLKSMYPDIKPIGVDSMDTLLKEYQQNVFSTWAALQFTLSDAQISTGLLIPSQTNLTSVSYAIYMSSNSNGLYTKNFTSTIYNEMLSDADNYWNSGYLTLQNYIYTYLAKQYNDVPSDFKVNTEVQRYPPSDLNDDIQNFSIRATRQMMWKWIGSTVLSVVLFVPLMPYLIEIVREHQYLMKELLDISGLMNISYWSAYFLMTVLNGLISLWASIAFLLGCNVLDARRVTPYGAICSVFIIGITCSSMFKGFLIPRSEYYGLPTFILIVILTIAGSFMMASTEVDVSTKLFCCFLHPSLGIAAGIVTIENYFYYHSGEMSYSFVNNHLKYPALGDIITVMIFSSLCYFILTLMMPLDWLWRNPVDQAATLYYNGIMDDSEFPCDNESMDENENNKKKVLEVNSLACIYPDGTRAVSNLSFHIKSGEVLSFLGANGAGKSTTMRMLCGTLNATLGDALIAGCSITTSRVEARRHLGIAMQQDIIWDDINVEDHLYLFGKLRGCQGEELSCAVEKMLHSLGFPEKRRALAGTLSGGQKRRLCVGLSMIGGSQVVFLDEPTAGLDPVSRRQLWELIQRNREGRGILLCTHFMDEADVLGDRIAIVKNGRLRALGTSRFLKERFGLGYLLRMSMKESLHSTEPIQTMIQQHVFEATVSSKAGTELSMHLPRQSVPSFPKLLEDLEHQASSIGVLSYAIETTTLEEVFMRIVNEDNELLLTSHCEANRILAASSIDYSAQQMKLLQRDAERNSIKNIKALLTKGINVSGDSQVSFWKQIGVIYEKRWFQFYRSRSQIIMGIVLPILLAIYCGYLLSNIPDSILPPVGHATNAKFTPFLPPLVSGPDQSLTMSLYSSVFGSNTKAVYVGSTYGDLYEQINEVTEKESIYLMSTNGIHLVNYSNFTVMYNASYPINFAGTVQQLLSAAISNVTDQKLQIDQQYYTLPFPTFGGQIRSVFFLALVIGLIAGSLGGGLSIVLVGERIGGVKHQQLASGTNAFAYWFGSFAFDLSALYTYIFVFTFIITMFNSNTFAGNKFGYVLFEGFLFALSSIFRFYIFSYGIPDVRLAQSWYFYGQLGAMYFFSLIWLINVFLNNTNVQDPMVKGLGSLFAVIEPGFGFMILLAYQCNLFGVLTMSSGENVLSIDVAGQYVLMTGLSSLIYAFIFIVLIENALASCCSASFLNFAPREQLTLKSTVPLIKTSQDKDVLAEVSYVDEMTKQFEQRPHQKQIKTLAAIFISHLRKMYLAYGNIPAKVAVQDMSLAIPTGEIFGLLGANGAGKSTLLKIVSGLEKPSQGRAWINGFDIVQSTSQAQRSMGLCPQFDTLLERLTVRENLVFFARMKGIENATVGVTVDAFLIALNIQQYQHKLTMYLSGGNRRKVSLAVALIGAPPTVYLDEPSTGLDPVASRLMWRLLTRIAEAKTTAMVLTTHNLLEAEAVCNRIGIMKVGELVALGDPLHLRQTHGTGYHLEMSLIRPKAINKFIAYHSVTKDSNSSPSLALSEMRKQVQNFVNEAFGDNVQLIEAHGTLLNYEIPRENIPSLARAFRLLQANQQRLHIEDYSLSQSTLEQVFLKEIRPASKVDESSDPMLLREPHIGDYIAGYCMWLVAALIPGAHQFYLGNFWRGFKYCFSLNEAYCGWLLDLFEIHVLVQKSVQEYGHTSCSCFTVLNANRSNHQHNDRVSPKSSLFSYFEASKRSPMAMQEIHSFHGQDPYSIVDGINGQEDDILL